VGSAKAVILTMSASVALSSATLFKASIASAASTALLKASLPFSPYYLAFLAYLTTLANF